MENIGRRGMPCDTGVSSICPYLLRIRAEILSVKFVDLEKRLRPHKRIIARRQGLRYAAIGLNENNTNGPYWFLEWTPLVNEHDESHRVLTEDKLDCIILSSSFGIVVQQRSGTMERLGRIGLYG